MKEKINRRTTILVALFLITTVFIAASLYAVSNRPAENANRISACDDPTPDSLHADSVFEQDYTRLPVDEETEIDILLPAGYRGSQASDFDHMYSESWYDFYEDGAGYFDLKKADLEIGNSYDDCIGDSVAYVGSARDGLLLIKGIKPAASGVETMKAEQDNVPAGEQMEFEFHGRKYRLRASGVNTGDQPEGDESSWDTVKNYKLYLSEAGSGNEQLLIAMPGFWDTKALILWIGDLDADAKPDFVFDVSDDYESKCVVLFFSSKADESQIVKCVGRSYYAFDC